MNYLCQLTDGKMLVLDEGNVRVEHTGYPYPDCEYNGIIGGDNILMSLGLENYGNYAKDVMHVLNNTDKMPLDDFKVRLSLFSKRNETKIGINYTKDLDFDSYSDDRLPAQVKDLCKAIGVEDANVEYEVLDWLRVNTYAIEVDANNQFGVLVGITSYGDPISGINDLVELHNMFSGHYGAMVHGVSVITDLNEIMECVFSDICLGIEAECYVWFNTTDDKDCDSGYALYDKDLYGFFTARRSGNVDGDYDRNESDSGYVELIGTGFSEDKDELGGDDFAEYDKKTGLYSAPEFHVSFNEYKFEM